MTDQDKILFIDRLLEQLASFKDTTSVPLMVGRLKKSQGINGFKTAAIGHPVFEYKDRYIIYLESLLAEKIAKFGEPVEHKYFIVAIPYYKETLSPIIDFLNEEPDSNLRISANEYLETIGVQQEK